MWKKKTKWSLNDNILIVFAFLLKLIAVHKKQTYTKHIERDFCLEMEGECDKGVDGEVAGLDIDLWGIIQEYFKAFV